MSRNTLPIPRVFSTEGKDPFLSVEWASRDATIANHKGEVIFEQKNVEFPKSFSQLATNVVASKYFYGDVADGNGSPADGQREFSFHQLTHRVARTIADDGVRQGMFSKADAETFYDELVWLTVNQYGSFNSPVWFNVGLYDEYGIVDKGGKTIFGWTPHGDPKKRDSGGVERVDPYIRPQASACFIVDVQDSIDDIWKLMSESARLFKYGSGVGADWSRLRSTREKLSGGGQPSGPVSFMRVQDATGGTIKSGGKTRRAAIMQTLRADHPDIMEFVSAKTKEEKKAHALIEAGYDGSFNGVAYGSVAFQNVNQSVRLDDEFMYALEHGEEAPLRGVDGEIIDTIDPNVVINGIAEGTFFCGDPGVQFDTTIQKWHTTKKTGKIWSSNPCSEFLYLDNTSCNLASLNLLKFRTPEGGFDVERYKAAARIFITAQEILVDKAGYPSHAIAQNSHDHRPIGLGFANLGALVMSYGLPYDSNIARSLAGAIMALEHLTAFETSGYMAGVRGPFNAYEENKESFLEVMRMHRDAAYAMATGGYEFASSSAGDPLLEALWTAAYETGESAVKVGEKYGYRNAQATVLAPTGTISFMMDCDTTGIEPDVALVKYKLLAGKGDGMMKIVNRTVPMALRRLGYDEVIPDGGGMTWIDAIVEYIDEHDTIEGCPALKEEHLPVFDCAFKPHKGKRSIHHAGHIKMMAACQPFVSGAISKTVNVPEDATVEDIRDAYLQSWKLGLKAVAVYRENSKRSQPLSTSKDGNTKQGASRAEIDILEAELADEKSLNESLREELKNLLKDREPKRRRLPDERPTIAKKLSVAGHEGYLHVGLYPDTGTPGEIFITMAKQGSTIAGLLDAFATSVSIGLQYGVPLDTLVRKFSFMSFEPSGFTGDSQLPSVRSIIDYIFRYLDQLFVTHNRKHTLDTFKAAAHRKTLPIPTSDGSLGDEIPEAVPALNDSEKPQSDAPACPNCGSITVRSGGCHSCLNCGSTTGCG